MQEIQGSSSIRGVDMVGTTLTVFFQSGKAYDYEDVPRETMIEMIQADSVGRYFSANIRPKFTGTLRTEDESDGDDQAGN